MAGKKSFENLFKNLNVSIDSTNSDAKSVVARGTLSIAQMPLSTTIDSFSSNERSDMRKEIYMNEKRTKEIEYRNNDIKRLEKSIRDLYDLFTTMLTLTQSQVMIFPKI